MSIFSRTNRHRDLEVLPQACNSGGMRNTDPDEGGRLKEQMEREKVHLDKSFSKGGQPWHFQNRLSARHGKGAEGVASADALHMGIRGAVPGH